jgi:hypothetical protein
MTSGFVSRERGTIAALPHDCDGIARRAQLIARNCNTAKVSCAE